MEVGFSWENVSRHCSSRFKMFQNPDSRVQNISGRLPLRTFQNEVCRNVFYNPHVILMADCRVFLWVPVYRSMLMTDSVFLQVGRGHAARLQGCRGQAGQFQIPLQGSRPRVWHREGGGRRGSKIIASTSFRSAPLSKHNVPLTESDMLMIAVPVLFFQALQRDAQSQTFFKILTSQISVFPRLVNPECYTVQVFQDGAVVPGWEGKIVAWVEEDHGERRQRPNASHHHDKPLEKDSTEDICDSVTHNTLLQ